MVKFSIYLNRRVFVMRKSISHVVAFLFEMRCFKKSKTMLIKLSPSKVYQFYLNDHELLRVVEIFCI